jgi:hypothetical protein
MMNVVGATYASYLPLQGGVRRVQHVGWGSSGAVTPPRIACGDPILPFQGRVKKERS